ncbi:MAG: outer membrane protein assembly factor BamD [Deltaproteobacteria bacterium]|nr:outer membrane protein assembly factor BamD [Deltaproteobacteria bacterium]
MEKYSVLFLLIFLAGCSLWESKPARYSTEGYFQQGEALLAKGEYKEAGKAWEKVLEAYVSPQMNMLAELKIAEAHYLAKEYAEAAAAYEDFLKRHPQERRTPDIMFQLGMSYYQQRLPQDRDQTATYNALVTFQSLERNFPNSNKVAAAKQKIAVLRTEMADHEFYVGKFYFKTKKYSSAISRFEQLLQSYPEYPDQGKIYFYLGRAFFKVDNTKKGVETFNTLSKKYPNSPYVAKASKYLPDNN